MTGAGFLPTPVVLYPPGRIKKTPEADTASGVFYLDKK